MAGTFKKFVGGLACESLQLNPNDSQSSGSTVSVIPYKSTNGNSFNTMYCYYTASESGAKSMKQAIPYWGLTPIATADDIKNYNLLDYEIAALGTTTFTKSRTLNSTGGSIIFAVTVTAGAEDITIKCIKFKKPVVPTNSTQYDILVCAYYLENPLTITAGASQSINVAFTVGEMSVNA